MDGLGIAFGDNLLGHPDVGLVAEISVHKIPEGLALILVLLGAGIERKKAIAWALGVEGMTIAGGVLGFYLVNSTSTFWLGILFAHVGGGFFCMIASTVKRCTRPTYRESAIRPTRAGEWLVFHFQCSSSWAGRQVIRNNELFSRIARPS
jgi:zinc and cadmium transporter